MGSYVTEPIRHGHFDGKNSARRVTALGQANANDGSREARRRATAIVNADLYDFMLVGRAVSADLHVDPRHAAGLRAAAVVAAPARDHQRAGADGSAHGE